MKRLALMCVVWAATVVLMPGAHGQASSWSIEVLEFGPDGIESRVRFATTEDGHQMTGAELTFISGLPDFEGCTLPASTAELSEHEMSTAYGAGARARAWFDGLVPPCNGTYTVDVNLTAHRYRSCDGFGQPSCEPSYGATTASMAYAIPPELPADVTAKTNDDRSVTVTWTPPYDDDNPAPPDFLGFLVLRVDQANKEEELDIEVSGDEFKDVKVPAAGGNFIYKVFSLRAGADNDSYAISDAVAAEKVTVNAAPPDSTSTTPPTSPDSSGDGGSGGVTSGGTSRGTRTSPFSTPRSTTTIPPDEGYESSLPFQSEPGEEEAQAPLDILDEDNGTGGTGLVRPIAVSLVLSIWAMHILFVTRSAQRANALVPAVIIEPVKATAEPPPPPSPPPPPPADPEAVGWLNAEDPLKWWASEQARGEP